MKKFTLFKRLSSKVLGAAALSLSLILAPSVAEAQTTTIIGTNSGANGTTTYPCPLADFYTSQRAQYYYNTGSLATIPNGAVITQIGWVRNATTIAGHLIEGYTISLKNSNIAGLSTTAWETGMTQVYNPTNYSYVSGSAGNVVFTLNTPFTYTGTGLVVEVCSGNTTSGWTSNPAVQWQTLVGYNASHTYRADYVNGCGNATVTNTGTATTRPRLVITYYIPTPCTGTPNAGTASISASAGCASTPFNLSASGLSAGTGITYQWQSSASPTGPWTNIPGATASSLTTSAATTTYYQLVSTCSSSGLSNTSSVVSYAVSTCSVVFTLTDSFGDGWNGATMNFVVNGTTFATLGTSFTTGTSQTQSFCVPSNSTYSLVYTAGGSWPTEVGISMSVSGTPVYSVGAGGATAGTTLTTGIACPPPCSSTPATPTVSTASATGCLGSTVALSSTGYTAGTGITYQWQSGPSATGPWTNIGGATATTYNATVVAGTTYYRLVTTCTSVSLSSNSNAVSITSQTCFIVPYTGNNSITTCSGTLYDHGGATGDYTTFANGYTVIYPSIAGNVIQISGTTSGEACCDYVRVYNGAGLGGTLLGTYNMNTPIPTLTSTSPDGALTVYFYSDVSINGAGFAININCIVPPPPAPTSITGSATAICEASGTQVSLTANGAVGTVFWFTGGCATTGSIATGTTINVSPATTTTYYARNFDGTNWSNNCTSYTVVVNPLPTNVNAGPDASVLCPGNSTPLTGSATIIPGVLSVVISGTGFLDEMSWTLVNSLGATIGSGGNYGTATTNTIPIASSANGPYTLNVETQGTFNDNIVNYSVICNGTTVLTGTLNGGLTTSAAVNSCGSNFTYSWSPSATLDNATITTPVASPTATTTYTFTVTENGCSASDQVVVSISDVTGPSVTPPANISVAADAGTCTASGIALGTPTTTDNCGVATTTNDGISVYPLGTTTVTWTVTDVSGNVTTATQTVTVTDSQNPTITAPVALSVNADAGTCIASGLALGTPTTADNCSVATVVNNAPSPFPLGVTTVTWTVTDGSGNTATATQTVTVTDNQNPTITAPVAVTVNADAGTCTATGVALGTPTTADNCSVATVVSDAPAAFPLGATTVTWTVTDGSGNTATATQTVTVIDNQNPTITAPSNVSVFADAGTCTATGVALGTPTTADNCSVASTVNDGLVTYPLGTTTVTWTVTDGSGNTATATQTVTVSDNQNPTITAPANVSVNTDPGLCSASAVSLGTPATADNCSVASVVSDAPATYPTGTTTVTWTVTDGSGNTATGTQTVTVTDNENPNALCQAVTIQLDATGNTSVTAAQVDNVSTDNCGIASMTLSQSSFTCANVGANPIVMTVTDVNGNSSTCLSIVTVQDIIAPTVVCQNITVQLDAAGVATITPAQIDNGSTDNCSIATMTLSQTTFGCFDSGANNVTLTVTDVNGNSSSCTAVVTVQDNVAPGFASSPLNITASAVDGLCGRVITYNVPTYFDACGAVLTQTDGSGLTTGDIFPVGVTTQTFTLTDASGNSIDTSFTITITDDELPVITNCPANITAAASATGCGSNVSWVEPVTSDNCPAVAVVSSNAPGSFFPVGTTTVTYTATDAAGNTSTCSFTVTVNDTLAPVVPVLATVSDACYLTVTAPTTTDNCAGTVTGTTTAPLTYNAQGTYSITWSFADGSGNTSTATQTVIVLDNSAPTITAPATVTATANAACTATGVVLGTPATSDNCAVANVTNDAPAAFSLGTTVVTWTVTDAAGNTSTATQNVTITDNTPPSISAPGALTVQANSSCAAFSVNLGTPITADNCGVASVTNNAPAVFPLGTTTVIWTVSDNSGNTTTATQVVTVVDQGAPSLVAPANITIPAGASCSVTPTSIGNAFTTDNCTAGSVTNNAPASFPIGTTTVTWTVTDGAGNTTTATQTVTVVDLVAPAITAPATVTATTTSGCSATGVVLGTPTTSDNCSSVTVTNNAPTSYPVGSTTVTWTATDASGNSTMAVQTVTVTDIIAPTVTAPANVTVSSTTGCTAQNVNLGSPEFSDNCSVASVTNNAPVTFPAGNTTVTWTVTDASGNTATATQTVTVVDQVDPTISAPATVNATTNSGCTATGVVLGTPTTADNCSAVTVTNNAPSSFPIGTTTVTWTATDASGNTATATQLVTITDAINPTITAPANVTAQANNSCAAFNVVLGTPTTADNCTVASVTNNAPAIFPLGTTTVTWTVTDASGHTATATQTVTVTDTQAPTIVAPASLNVTTTANCEASGLTLGTPFATDNCSISSVVNDAPLNFPVGVTVITWTATDASGNTATATQTVTVTDAINPTAQVQDITVVLNTAGAASITFADVDLGSSDNCGLASTTLSQSDFDCGDVGENTITVTLIDVNGNSTVTTIKVTVETNGIDSDNDGIDDSCDGTTDPIEADIPEAFTPNGNNINDLFVVGNIEFYNERSIEVFNRYGNQVYANSEYNNDWDGTRSDNGQALPDGTYYYVLTLNGEIKKGFVYINRVKQ